MSTLGERLKELRLIHCKTQEEIGQILNVSKTAISNYERNTAIPSTNKLITLAKYYNINVSYFIGDSDRMFEEGVEYKPLVKAALLDQETVLALPKVIAPYAAEYIDIPLNSTNANIFAVKMPDKDGKTVTVIAERGRKPAGYVLTRENGSLKMTQFDKNISKNAVIASVVLVMKNV